jgi:hypothetical protein
VPLCIIMPIGISSSFASILSFVLKIFFVALFQPRERGRMRFHMLQNVQIALDFLRYRKVSQIMFF